jgi:outer membrane PBP1 activator LpoA protein
MYERHKGILRFLAVTVAALLMTACSPEVGSEKWCQQMKDKPKADWSANDAGNFAKHCVF